MATVLKKKQYQRPIVNSVEFKDQDVLAISLGEGEIGEEDFFMGVKTYGI